MSGYDGGNSKGIVLVIPDECVSEKQIGGWVGEAVGNAIDHRMKDLQRKRMGPVVLK